MITSIRLVNFKNFADETLRLGPFTVIVGANASGKSNIRDAFRFLHGIGRGYTLAEILGGKYGSGGQMEWSGIRGAPNEVVRFERRYPNEWSKFSIEFELTLGEEKAFYSISVGLNPGGPDGFRVREEELNTESMVVYKVMLRPGGASFINVKPTGDNGEEQGRLSPGKPVLHQIVPIYQVNQRQEGAIGAAFLRAIHGIRFIEFSPQLMREPSVPGASFLGDSGQNLPTVLEAICAEPERKRTLMSWLKELSPMDVKEFEFPTDPSGRVHLQIVERNGRKVSAYSASDGTLRFLALLAILLSPNRGGVYFFEDIDAGIHPARLWLLLDFIERQTAKGNVQVITTTHSPALLTWMNDSTFEHTSIVYRDETWADSAIRPISELPKLRELRKSDTLGELFTENWMDNMLAFTEVKPDSNHLDDEDEGTEG
jgi:predicted ATPase